TSSKILSQVNNNTQLEILDASSDWWKVRTPNGTEGFMHSSRIVKGDRDSIK
ncbi:MAG: SH3 domain-containing protein, partial [Muricauda sp. TMED12]